MPANHLDLSVVLKNHLEAFLETRRAVAALLVASESLVPGFRQRYEEALEDPASTASAQLNPQWVAMAQRVLTDLSKAVPD
ncbi:MAG TPA: hypothetical protein VMT20_19825 [Terriglobia bacterium]|nr:hypothetical protein [Terriglobia bacterium]